MWEVERGLLELHVCLRMLHDYKGTNSTLVWYRVDREEGKKGATDLHRVCEPR